MDPPSGHRSLSPRVERREGRSSHSSVLAPASLRGELERRLGQLPGLIRRASPYSDSYFVADREIAHFHGESRIDVRLTKERIPELKSAGFLDSRVKTRGPSADWVALRVEARTDIDYALELVEAALCANS